MSFGAAAPAAAAAAAAVVLHVHLMLLLGVMLSYLLDLLHLTRRQIAICHWLPAIATASTTKVTRTKVVVHDGTLAVDQLGCRLGGRSGRGRVHAC